MSDDYANASDALARVIGNAKDGSGIGYHYETDHLTVDQQLQVVQIQALLSISQELSALNPQNTSINAKDGTTRNGWGMIVPK